jgi:hypothetical protein
MSTLVKNLPSLQNDPQVLQNALELFIQNPTYTDFAFGSL